MFYYNMMNLRMHHCFRYNENFVAPSIKSTQIQKEMLFSLLQKNFQRDLSSFDFSIKESFWEISHTPKTVQMRIF